MREKSELREEDEKMSKAISCFLDEHFYKTETNNFERCFDKKRQIQGIDVIFEFNGHKYLCDEKASVRYRGIKTFILELSFINKNNEIQEGWLTNKNDKNDSFLFVWIDNDAIEIALIKREAIFQHLCSLGWTKEKLRFKAKKIRDNINEPLGTIEKNGCRFIISRQLVEQPINIQMARNTYLEISDYHKKYYTTEFKR